MPVERDTDFELILDDKTYRWSMDRKWLRTPKEFDDAFVSKMKQVPETIDRIAHAKDRESANKILEIIKSQKRTSSTKFHGDDAPILTRLFPRSEKITPHMWTIMQTFKRSQKPVNGRYTVEASQYLSQVFKSMTHDLKSETKHTVHEKFPDGYERTETVQSTVSSHTRELKGELNSCIHVIEEEQLEFACDLDRYLDDKMRFNIQDREDPKFSSVANYANGLNEYHLTSDEKTEALEIYEKFMNDFDEDDHEDMDTFSDEFTSLVDKINKKVPDCSENLHDIVISARNPWLSKVQKDGLLQTFLCRGGDASRWNDLTDRPTPGQMKSIAKFLYEFGRSSENMKHWTEAVKSSIFSRLPSIQDTVVVSFSKINHEHPDLDDAFRKRAGMVIHNITNFKHRNVNDLLLYDVDDTFLKNCAFKQVIGCPKKRQEEIIFSYVLMSLEDYKIKNAILNVQKHYLFEHTCGIEPENYERLYDEFMDEYLKNNGLTIEEFFVISFDRLNEFIKCKACAKKVLIMMYQEFRQRMQNGYMTPTKSLMTYCIAVCPECGEKHRCAIDPIAKRCFKEIDCPCGKPFHPCEDDLFQTKQSENATDYMIQDWVKQFKRGEDESNEPEQQIVEGVKVSKTISKLLPSKLPMTVTKHIKRSLQEYYTSYKETFEHNYSHSVAEVFSDKSMKIETFEMKHKLVREFEESFKDFKEQFVHVEMHKLVESFYDKVGLLNCLSNEVMIRNMKDTLKNHAVKTSTGKKRPNTSAEARFYGPNFSFGVRSSRMHKVPRFT